MVQSQMGLEIILEPSLILRENLNLSMKTYKSLKDILKETIVQLSALLTTQSRFQITSL